MIAAPAIVDPSCQRRANYSSNYTNSHYEAENSAEKALELNDSFDLAHILLGWTYLFKRQHDRAIKEGERAIELNPNGAEAHAQLAFFLILSDTSSVPLH